MRAISDVLLAIAAFGLVFFYGPTLPAQNPGADSYYGGSSPGGYGGSSGPSASHGSTSGGSRGSSSNSSYGSSNSGYGGSANTYGRSSNTYGRSSNTYGSSTRRNAPSSSRKTTSSSATPSRSNYESTRRVDYGASRNSYGLNRNTYGTSPDTYRNGTRNAGRRQGGGLVRQDPRASRNWDNPWARMQGGARVRPLMVRGRIVGSDGQPVPDAVVRLNCGGGSYPLGYADRRGRYSVILNSCYPALSMADASIAGFRGRGLLFRPSACWLETRKAGYRLGRIDLGVMRGAGANHDLGSLILDKLAADGNPTVSIDTLLAPETARKAYRKGLRALRKSEPNSGAAAKHLASAVEIHPSYAPAWVALGEARMASGQRNLAREAFRKAIAADPKLLAPYESLIQVAIEDRNWSEVETLAESYLQLAPSSSTIWRFRAVAALMLKDMDDLEQVIRKMKDLGETSAWPRAHYMQALVHTTRAEFEPAAVQYEAFLARSSPDDPLAHTAKRVIYEWSKLQVIEPRDSSDVAPQASARAPTLR